MNTEAILAGKVAIITGAGRGIGRSIDLGYARAGAAVGCAARTMAEIDQLADQIRQRKRKSISYQNRCCTTIISCTNNRRMWFR